MRKFLDWVAWYTLAPKGSALAMGLKLAEEGRAEMPRVGRAPRRNAAASGSPPRGPASSRWPQGGLVHVKRELAQAASVSVGVIDGLVDEGTLETVALPPEPVGGDARTRTRPSPALRGQREAAQALVAAVAEGGGASRSSRA